METYFETLRDYVLAQQPDLGDGETVLEMIYECYSQLNCMDNETIRKDFEYSAFLEPSVRRVRATIPVGQSRCSGQREPVSFSVQL